MFVSYPDFLGWFLCQDLGKVSTIRKRFKDTACFTCIGFMLMLLTGCARLGSDDSSLVVLMTTTVGYQERFLGCLQSEDDPEFWNVAIATLLQDVEAELVTCPPRRSAYAQIGACSHWLRPHQTRWKAAGGFAWPTGYGGSGFSRLGLPEFDWSILMLWKVEQRIWLPVEKFQEKRRFLFRAALPTRTKRHLQVAVHTVWLPRKTSQSDQKSTTFYGFRKLNEQWTCVAYD